ncbi:MAG: archease [Gammaproteobacteria bacterium]|nr:archease [Gammaproteobacteria bacterium]
MGKAYWEHFEHKADIGIRGFGNTMAEAFTQVAIALTAVITDIALINATTAIQLSCSDPDNDTLLYDWLNTLVYEMATRKMLFSQFEISIDVGELKATVSGEAIDMKKHQPAVEIKGATYTELAVYSKDGQWVAQCVVDV